MKKILFSFFAIAAVAAVAGTGSWAYFNDTERAVGNSMTSDQLDLRLSLTGVAGSWVDDNDLELAGAIPVEIVNTFPGDHGTASVYVKNESASVDGTLSFEVDNIVSTEEGIIEPEADAGDVTDPAGELCENIDVTVLYNGSGTTVTDMPITDFTSSISLGVLTAGAEGELTITYSIDGVSVGNNIMTDKCTFDLAADLEQVI